jgi:hypothetical protein
LVATSAAAAVDPILTFESQSVTAQVTPGATTVWFGVKSEYGAYTPRTSEYAQILQDTDNDGTVRIELNAPAPVAVWMVVDMSTGGRTIATPAGVIVQRKSLPGAALTHASESASASVLIEQEDPAVCWVVRPATGAWRMIVMDGGNEDQDGLSDGSVTSSLESLQAVGSSPEPPDDFAPGDIVVTVALDDLAVADLRVDQ